MAPPPRLFQERIQERQTEGDRCLVCYRPVYRVSSYCERHGAIRQATGSPHGHKLGVEDLGQYLAAVVPWLTLNAKHPDIIAAAAAIARRLEAARRDVELRPNAGQQPIPKLYSREQTKAVTARLNVYLADLTDHGMSDRVDVDRLRRAPDKPRCEGRIRVNLKRLTTAERVLAFVAAAYLHRYTFDHAEIAFWDTGSDEHFAQQIGSLILRRAREKSLRLPGGDGEARSPAATVARAFGRFLIRAPVIELAAIRLSILARRGDLASQCDPPYQVPPPKQGSPDFRPKRRYRPRPPQARPEPSPQLPDAPELPDQRSDAPDPQSAPVELPPDEPDWYGPDEDLFLPADPHQQPHDGA